MRTIEMLESEHRTIEFGLNVLEAMIECLQQGESVPPERIEALLNFFRVFGEWCHEMKEESILLPALARAGGSQRNAALGVTEAEHREARELLQRMTAVVPQLERQWIARREFVQVARAYVQLLRDHIQHEDQVLFRLAEAQLRDQDALLSLACERHERGVLGEGAHARLRGLITELELEFLNVSAARAEAVLVS